VTEERKGVGGISLAVIGVAAGAVALGGLYSGRQAAPGAGNPGPSPRQTPVVTVAPELAALTQAERELRQLVDLSPQALPYVRAYRAVLGDEGTAELEKLSVDGAPGAKLALSCQEAFAAWRSAGAEPAEIQASARPCGGSSAGGRPPICRPLLALSTAPRTKCSSAFSAVRRKSWGQAVAAPLPWRPAETADDRGRS
jgi:hypothetical protein